MKQAMTAVPIDETAKKVELNRQRTLTATKDLGERPK